jgi:hypothetical protein
MFWFRLFFGVSSSTTFIWLLQLLRLPLLPDPELLDVRQTWSRISQRPSPALCMRPSASPAQLNRKLGPGLTVPQ